MIIVLNGYPGVGKLRIGSELATLMDGRMLDIHSVYNVAFALTEFKSPEFVETVEQIESIARAKEKIAKEREFEQAVERERARRSSF